MRIGEIQYPTVETATRMAINEGDFGESNRKIRRKRVGVSQEAFFRGGPEVRSLKAAADSTRGEKVTTQSGRDFQRCTRPIRRGRPRRSRGCCLGLSRWRWR